ncbi:permease [Saccharibacter sp. 17.LH.SD]|uniref:AEC family transporter n=1 Tax=Saccharibacter sp. 17.LH.SD TaxID=2689393 RepID=UPI00136B8CC6|nr:AEC family transporter [Saccharibacter sp. 17.LH.SD]MXV44869.1 permease [Saccharibacter sp. 17.LH.SD]
MTSTLLLTIIQAIFPILVTLGIGYIAAWRKDFNTSQANTLIRMVMLYALPLALFASILGTPRDKVLTAGPLALLILFAMAGLYVLFFVILRWGIKRRQAEAALIALTVTGPSVPFIGIPVLGQLFGASSAVPVSIAALIMNLFQLPLTIMLMSHDQRRSTSKDEHPLTFKKNIIDLGNHLLHACHEPIVWAPLLALFLVILGMKIPPSFKSSFLLLGHATGGTALFASGVVLFARQVRFSALVGSMITIRNILIPLGVYGIARFIHLPSIPMQEGVLTMAIPSAAINVILAMRYHVLEREIASVLFFGTLSAIITMASFIWLVHS